MANGEGSPCSGQLISCSKTIFRGLLREEPDFSSVISILLNKMSSWSFTCSSFTFSFPYTTPSPTSTGQKQLLAFCGRIDHLSKPLTLTELSSPISSLTSAYICFHSLCMHYVVFSGHLFPLLQFREQDNAATPILKHHSPKVHNSILQWHLCGYVGPLLFVALHKQ